MRHYEIVALVDPNQSEQINELVARYRKIVEDSGGTVHRYENWGRRKLGYPIQKVYKAAYFLLNIECEPSAKDEIENAFRYNDSILRSLIIRQDKAITEKSPILKKIIKREEEEKQAAEEQAEREAAEAKAKAKAIAETEAAAKETKSDDDSDAVQETELSESPKAQSNESAKAATEDSVAETQDEMPDEGEQINEESDSQETEEKS